MYLNLKLKGVLAVFLFFSISSCASFDYSAPDNQGFVSISGSLKLPLLSSVHDYFLDEGPLFVMQKDPVFAYRVIYQKEIEFVGSKKKVFDFFNDSYLKPSDMSEISFSESLSGYKKSHLKNKNIDFFIYKNVNETKVYVVSVNLDFGVEATLSNTKNETALNTLINQAKLVSGE